MFICMAVCNSSSLLFQKLQLDKKTQTIVQKNTPNCLTYACWKHI